MLAICYVTIFFQGRKIFVFSAYSTTLTKPDTQPSIYLKITLLLVVLTPAYTTFSRSLAEKSTQKRASACRKSPEFSGLFRQADSRFFEREFQPRRKTGLFEFNISIPAYYFLSFNSKAEFHRTGRSL